MQTLNLALFQMLAAGHTPDPIILLFASATAVGASWLCLALFAWAAWRYPTQRIYALTGLIACGLASMAAHSIAAALDIPRPFMAGLSPAHIDHGERGSLPSAHASVMFTIALLFFLRAPLRRIGIALFVIAAATGWARIYVGVHFPLDILAGLLLASAIAAAFWLLHYLGRLANSSLAARAQRARAA